ncbi:MAG: circadian clock protein KaiC [Myxococcota bacterium]|nr:circadian clock protein KaiC [Myxococcota bacterium]
MGKLKPNPKQSTKRTSAESGFHLPKSATGIKGLDTILEGGLPKERITLVIGGPGCGKSIFAFESLSNAASRGEPTIYVTFEETAEAVRQNALTLGIDLAPLEKSGKLFILAAQIDSETAVNGEFDTKGLTAILEAKVEKMGARLIALDALDVLLRFYDDPARERNELHRLNDWVRRKELTAIFTVKDSQDPTTVRRYEFLDYLTDVVICLDQRIECQIATRRLRIVKYRGSACGRNEYPYIIGPGGIAVAPISSMGLRHKPLGERMSSGHPRLDNMLGGGFRRYSAVLVAGTSGTGKTTLAATFVAAACARGEKVLYIGFEESEESMIESLLSSGIDLRPAMRKETLRFLTGMPESMGAEEHLLRALRVIEEHRAEHVIVDAISSCRRMGSKQAAFDYSVLLMNACKERGSTLFFLNQTEGFQGESEISGADLSSLIDTVIFLRYIQVGGEVNRIALVMKARGSRHSNQCREFLITDKGIDLLDVYIGEGGVLTGTARREQEAKEAIERRKKEAEIKAKEKEIEKIQRAIAAERSRLQAEMGTVTLELESLELEKQISDTKREQRAAWRGEDSDSSRLEKAPKRTGNRRSR